MTPRGVTLWVLLPDLAHVAILLVLGALAAVLVATVFKRGPPGGFFFGGWP